VGYELMKLKFFGTHSVSSFPSSPLWGCPAQDWISDMSISVSQVANIAVIVSWISKGEQVRYLTDSGEEREAHLRGYAGSNSDVETAQVRLSDWMSEWTMPLVDLAAKLERGELALK
jgi:hypothetical protein